MDQSRNYFKITLIGHGYTGKTSLLRRYTEDEFDDRYVATQAFDFITQPIQRGGKRYDLHIWTLSGQACKYPSSVPPINFRGSDAIICVFAVDDEMTMSVLDIWKKKALEVVHPDVPFILVANKCDKRRMDERDIRNMADQNGYYSWFQTSAQTGKNVSELFEGVADILITESRISSHKRSIINLEPPRKKKKCVCAK
ncbi:ras-related protein Rab-9A-like isoform X2 [Symsagittifera roscoffensis]|uniref:ras-related protein Rab-9A-like isoform X2 n=1 Tax=Symsagittifera roscoffensis TaxID=84072 RepID=UPI00307C47F4